MTNAKPEAVPAVRAAGAAPLSHRRLWADAPLLRSGQGHAGRVMAEVWADGSCWLLTSNPSLYGPALTAMEDGPIAHNPEVELPESPSIARHEGSQFLGRLIVEFMSQREPAVATIGSDQQSIVTHARRRLRQMVAAG
jgi:hypothetical protein